MSHPNSTETIEIEAATGATSPLSPHTLSWSFGASRDRLVLPLVEKQSSAGLPSANRNGASPTVAPQKMDVPDRRPKSPPRVAFGRRGFIPLYQWEGVVEEVKQHGFRARLAPLHGAGVALARPEFTEFEFDDLSDPSDEELVEIGAVF